MASPPALPAYPVLAGVVPCHRVQFRLAINIGLCIAVSRCGDLVERSCTGEDITSGEVSGRETERQGRAVVASFSCRCAVCKVEMLSLSTPVQGFAGCGCLRHQKLPGETHGSMGPSKVRYTLHTDHVLVVFKAANAEGILNKRDYHRSCNPLKRSTSNKLTLLFFAFFPSPSSAAGADHLSRPSSPSKSSSASYSSSS